MKPKTFGNTVIWHAAPESLDQSGRLRDALTGRFLPTCREFEVHGTVSPFIPAYTTGLPENCYPAEGGEVEITKVNEIITTGRGRRQRYETVPSNVDVLEQLGLTEQADELLADEAASYDPDEERDWDAEREAREERAEICDRYYDGN